MSNPDSPSLTPPQGNSRSSSPANTGGPQQRIVSGSLKDRIAKFNNPSAPPPIPKQHFASGSSARGGLIGNRIPSLDPKSAGHVVNPAVGRRVSENRGLIGNRIPSMGSGGAINVMSGQNTGSSVPPPTNKTPTVRSASPAGSVDSSTASATLDSSASPITSRSSSPPTSPGAGVPPSLLAATLPGLDDGGPGAATPSSTRAEIGDAVSELSLSMPSTPVAGSTPPLPAPEYDLVAPNLKLATANAAAEAGLPPGAPNAMVRGLSAQSGADSFAPSISSSLATQSRGSEEETKMMDDVSGISTPTGTPRAAHRELGDGSVVGEGSVIGDNDVEDLGAKLEALGVAPTSVVDPSKPFEDEVNGPAATQSTLPTGSLHESAPASAEEEGPDQASDLADVKAGKLDDPSIIAKDTAAPNPTEEIVAAAMTTNIAGHVIPPEEKKEQGGAAGQRMEDVEKPDAIEPPKSEKPEYDEGGPEIREATPGVESLVDGKELGDGGVPEEAASSEPQQASELDIAGEITETQTQPEGTATRSSGTEPLAQHEIPTAPEVSPSALAAEEKEVLEPREETSEIADDGASTPKSASSPQIPATKVDEPTIIVPGIEVNKEQVVSTPERPAQITIEPAPIAQPVETVDAEVEAEPKVDSEIPDSLDDDKTPAAEIEPPAFPTPPTADPDEEDPIIETADPAPGPDADAMEKDALAAPAFDESAASTPVDPTFLKAFPAVPDEEKPRVEVHVSSPASTPQKSAAARRSSSGQESAQAEPATPLAKLPGHSKSLSNTSGSPESQSGTDAASPDSASALHESTSLSSVNEDLDATPQAKSHAQTQGQNLSKRLSTRRSPKSPLLDDEDPGDFEPGEGWAVVTKWVWVVVICFLLMLQLMTNLVLAFKGS